MIIMVSPEDEQQAGYVKAEFSALAERIHPDACVAWDRDCADIMPVPMSSHDPHSALRFCRDGGNRWSCFSGEPWNRVARWDPEKLRWRTTDLWYT